MGKMMMVEDYCRHLRRTAESVKECQVLAAEVARELAGAGPAVIDLCLSLGGRKSRKMSLRALAAAAGCGATYLSLVRRRKMAISAGMFLRLLAVAEKLGGEHGG